MLLCMFTSAWARDDHEWHATGSGPRNRIARATLKRVDARTLFMVLPRVYTQYDILTNALSLFNCSVFGRQKTVYTARRHSTVTENRAKLLSLVINR